jgi:hypothetical protein
VALSGTRGLATLVIDDVLEGRFFATDAERAVDCFESVEMRWGVGVSKSDPSCRVHLRYTLNDSPHGKISVYLKVLELIFSMGRRSRGGESKRISLRAGTFHATLPH